MTPKSAIIVSKYVNIKFLEIQYFSFVWFNYNYFMRIHKIIDYDQEKNDINFMSFQLCIQK